MDRKQAEERDARRIAKLAEIGPAVGQGLARWINQAQRSCEIVAVKGTLYVYEYEMPSGKVYARLGDTRTGRERTVSERSRPAWAVEGQWAWDAEGPFEATVQLDKQSLAFEFFESLPTGADVSGTLQVRGTSVDLETVVVEGTLTEARFDLGTRSLRSTAAFPLAKARSIAGRIWSGSVTCSP